MPVTEEQKALSDIAKEIYDFAPADGKYIIDGARLVICQSNIASKVLQKLYPNAQVNPLGDWTGGTDVDTGATNRKLGSDMADSVTGGIATRTAWIGKQYISTPVPIVVSLLQHTAIRGVNIAAINATSLTALERSVVAVTDAYRAKLECYLASMLLANGSITLKDAVNYQKGVE